MEALGGWRGWRPGPPSQGLDALAWRLCGPGLESRAGVPGWSPGLESRPGGLAWRPGIKALTWRMRKASDKKTEEGENEGKVRGAGKGDGRRDDEATVWELDLEYWIVFGVGGVRDRNRMLEIGA